VAALEQHEALRALRAAGIRATPADAHTLTTATGETIHWGRTHRLPTPSDVHRELRRLLPGERLLYAVPHATPSLTSAALADPRLIVVSDNDRAVYVNQARHELEGAPTPAPAPTKGPVPYGQYAVLRALLVTTEPATQHQLAAATGLTQPAISNALRALVPLVERTAAGWTLTDTAAAWGQALTVPLNGVTTYWWSDLPLTEQAAALPDDALISGDLAADRIAAWRMPEHVTAYLRSGIDLSTSGFTLGSSDDYTLSVTIPADKTIWATADHAGRPGTADPVITARDVLRTGTTGDQQEAADRIRAATRTPRTPTA
jgi:hypothetical protein